MKAYEIQSNAGIDALALVDRPDNQNQLRDKFSFKSKQHP